MQQQRHAVAGVAGSGGVADETMMTALTRGR
jgi:hypothetical protein